MPEKPATIGERGRIGRALRHGEGRMANLSASGDRKLGGFISYSRKDEDFAQELLAGLEAASTGRYLD
jgi:hypothetical protein